MRTDDQRLLMAGYIALGTGFALILTTLAGFFVTFWSDLLGITSDALPRWHAYLHTQNTTVGTFFKPFLAVLSLALAWMLIEFVLFMLRNRPTASRPASGNRR